MIDHFTGPQYRIHIFLFSHLDWFYLLFSAHCWLVLSGLVFDLPFGSLVCAFLCSSSNQNQKSLKNQKQIRRADHNMGIAAPEQYIYQWQCHSRFSATNQNNPVNPPISRVRLPLPLSSKSNTLTSNNTTTPPIPTPPVKPHRNRNSNNNNNIRKGKNKKKNGCGSSCSTSDILRLMDGLRESAAA